MKTGGDIRKLIQLSGERAKLDAQANQTYVVYKDESGKIVKEHFDGRKEVLAEQQEHV